MSSFQRESSIFKPNKIFHLSRSVFIDLHFHPWQIWGQEPALIFRYEIPLKQLDPLNCTDNLVYSVSLRLPTSVWERPDRDVLQPSHPLSTSSNDFMAFLDACQDTECTAEGNLIILVAWTLKKWVKWRGEGRIRGEWLCSAWVNKLEGSFWPAQTKESLKQRISHSLTRRLSSGTHVMLHNSKGRWEGMFTTTDTAPLFWSRAFRHAGHNLCQETIEILCFKDF